MSETNPANLDSPTPRARTATPSSPLGWIADGMNAVGSLLIMAVMLLICADVIARSFLGAPIKGVSEIVAMSIVAIVFLQLASTLRAGRMSRAELFIDAFMLKHPRAGAFLQGLFDLVGVFVFAVIVWASWPILKHAWTDNEFFGVQGVFIAPTWPVKLMVVVGATLAAIQYLVNAAQNLRWALGARTERPS
jgi:TRAP-type mannitol/chloroaromatic compound transport system permease small subunit